MTGKLVVRIRRPGFSIRLPRRATAVVGVLLALNIVTICLATSFGTYPISIRSVIGAVLGHGDQLDQLAVRRLRLPRILEGDLVGAALGLAGAIFQLLTRNPLASPDLLGVNEAAAVVAVWMILSGVSVVFVPIGAFGGALAAALLVGILTVRRRFSMYRVILVGIGINFFAAAIISYLLTHATYERSTVQYAQQWLSGSLYYSSWQQVRILGAVLLVILPLTLSLGRRLNVLQLGDDIAAALGVSSASLQIGLTAIGVLLAAVAVSAAGPIGFVAFMSPHIARRLARTTSAAVLPVAAGVGALLVMLADYTAKRVLEPSELPVGIVIIVLSGPYLLFLLQRAERTTGVG